MSLSLHRKKSAESNKIDKTKPSAKNFKQIYQENKNRPLTKNEKRGWAIFGGIIIAIIIIAHISNIMEQSRLEKDNIPIVISDIEDNIKLDYHTDKREISAKISGVSSFAKVKISGDKTDIHDRKDAAGNIKYEVKNIKEGDSDISISVTDGKRHSDKTVKFHRQTKTDYDKQELEKSLKYTEEVVKKAEKQPTDENISRAKSDINRLPEDKRAPFSERIAKLEKAKQEEKERAEQAKKAAEEKKKQEEAAAASARRQQARSSQPTAAPRQAAPAPQPAPAELNFGSCKEARAAGYSHMRRGEPGYSSHLDGDNDGVACDKHK
jgi:excalibur domain protein